MSKEEAPARLGPLVGVLCGLIAECEQTGASYQIGEQEQFVSPGQYRLYAAGYLEDSGGRRVWKEKLIAVIEEDAVQFMTEATPPRR
jgi:hypothetical protein